MNAWQWLLLLEFAVLGAGLLRRYGQLKLHPIVVKETVYVDVEVPIERVVEKVVYRERPPLEAIEQAAQARAQFLARSMRQAQPTLADYAALQNADYQHNRGLQSPLSSLLGQSTGGLLG